jgi:UDP-glucuronate 4-epimerase
MATALITGAAGFVGSFAAKHHLIEVYRVVDLDCISDAYDVTLKEARLAKLQSHNDFRHVLGKVEYPGLLMSPFREERP